MRPNVQTTRDPLNVAALPDTAGMELDYRTQRFDNAADVSVTVHAVVVSMLVGMAAVVGLRIFGAYISTPRFLALATLIGGAFAVHRFLTERGVLAVVLWLLAGPLIWLLSVATNSSLLVLLLFAAVGLFLHWSHAATYHYARWMHANRYLERNTRQRWLTVWRPCNWFDHLRSFVLPEHGSVDTNDPLVARETQERTRYARGFAAVILGYLAAVLVYLLCGDGLLRGVVAVAVFVVSTTAYGVLNVMEYDPPLSPQLVSRTLWRAFVSWCTYNLHGTRAPGVFRSPSGSAFRRRAQLRFTLLLAALAILPAASYFPLGVTVFGYAPWLKAAASPMPWDNWQSTLHRAEGSPPQDSDTGRASPHSPPSTKTSQERFLEQYPASRREAVRQALVTTDEERRASTSAYRRLQSRPEACLAIYGRGLMGLDPRMIFSMLLAFVGCLIAPPLLLFATWFAVGGRVLVHHLLTLEGEAEQSGAYHPTPIPSPWEAYTRRLAASQFVARDAHGQEVRENRHLLIGFQTLDDYPVLLSPGVLKEHAHIMGDTGSGKSALGLAPLIAQLIDRGDSSVVILDLKGDMALFEGARLVADQVNRRRKGSTPAVPFLWFTNHPQRSTHLFNPLLQSDMQTVSRHQKVEILIKSLGLDYGEGFGTSYYSSVHRHVMSRILEQPLEFKSLRQLHEYLRNYLSAQAKDLGLDKRARDDATHLYTVVESLASFDAINLTPKDPVPPAIFDRQIDMGKIVRSPHVVYFSLPSALEETSVREIAKLALHCLLVAAVRRGTSDHQVYLFVDEFQQVVSEHLEVVLRQARSSGIAAILANQTLSDLRKGNVNIIPTVQANTRFKQIFSATDLLQQNSIIEASGEAMYEFRSWTENELGEIEVGRDGNVWYKMSEQIGPRLRRNDVIGASDSELQSIVHVSRGHGFTQFGGFPFPMSSMFHIAAGEYKKRQTAAWPVEAEHPGAFTPPVLPEKSTPAGARPPIRMPPPEQQVELVNRIDQL